MNIHIIRKTDTLWLPVSEYADTCSWDACVRMATFMREDKFNDWERIFIAEENGNFMGFCALIKPQGFPGSEYNPLIKWLFVEEKYRGQRLSQKLLETAAEYAKKLGYDQIFLTTWHKGLYEKYGFMKICDKEVRDGYFEGIYGKKID
ncbi:MAG: GNAT family N-acetyltransferase [Eubacteriales bacterium]|nr:GNAT family N-acetyltransferase [Clostridia bacterium]MDD4494612.1 GNAT family N-acetyltransferase [Eubacteriales bacterium]